MKHDRCGQLDSFQTGSGQTEVPRFPRISSHGNTWQTVATCRMELVATCAHLTAIWQTVQYLRPARETSNARPDRARNGHLSTRSGLRAPQDMREPLAGKRVAQETRCAAARQLAHVVGSRRVLLSEILLPRIARQGTVCLIPTRGSARKARIEKFELDEGFQPYHPLFRVIQACGGPCG